MTRAVQRARDELRPEGRQSGSEGRDTEGAVPVVRRSSVFDAVDSPGRRLEPRVLQRAEQAYGMDFGEVTPEGVGHVRRKALGQVPPGTHNGGDEKASHPNDAFEVSVGSNGRKPARGVAPDLCSDHHSRSSIMIT